ncbi:MAG: sugar nucleotide-binding protein [Halopseudomonas sp.]
MFELPALLVVGAQGQLGYEVDALAREEGFEVTALDSDQLDILDPAAVAAVLAEHQPRFLINAAATLHAYEETSAGYAVNTRGAAILAESCRKAGCVMLHVSCAEVLDGDLVEPYAEDYEPSPKTLYAKSKLRGEALVRAALPYHIIIRTGWLFSARSGSYVRELLEQARLQKEIEVVDGLVGAPTPASDLARVLLAIVKQLDCGIECWGTYHYTSSESISWFGFAESIVAAARQYEDIPLERLLAVPQAELVVRQRPANSQLDCHKILNAFGIHQRAWRSGLMQVIRSYYSWTA